MDAEVVAVGSELLLGQIANTNAQSISQALARVGVATLRHSAVGDDTEAIAALLREALQRADVVVVSGGLGPTHDDLTREAVAAATGRALERRADLVANLEERFRRMGRTMAAANLRQAECPAGATAIANPVGTAPGIFLEQQGRLLFALPGVPGELVAMLTGFVQPQLAARTQATLVTRTIRTAGIAESDLAERIDPTVARLGAAGQSPGNTPVPGTPRLAILASEGEVRLCLTATAAPGEVPPAVAALDAELRQLLGPLVYGGDGDTLESVVSGLLRARSLHLAVAESLTGGMLAARLVAIPGASDILLAGYVAYSAAAKVRDLAVPGDTLRRYGLVSEQTAQAMAMGARQRAGADLGLSTTGEAGPAPAEARVGQVCIGLAWEGGSAAWSYSMGGSREMIRRRACTWALHRLYQWLSAGPGT